MTDKNLQYKDQLRNPRQRTDSEDDPKNSGTSGTPMKLSGIGSDEAGLAGEDSDPPNGSVSASKSIPPWKDPPEAAQASHKGCVKSFNVWTHGDRDALFEFCHFLHGHLMISRFYWCWVVMSIVSGDAIICWYVFFLYLKRKHRHKQNINMWVCMCWTPSCEARSTTCEACRWLCP